MKFIYILIFTLFVATFSYAQEYKKFRVGLGVGYATAGGNGSSGGAIITFEPSYRVQDNLSIGLRLETALVTRGYSQNTSGASISVAAIGSYTVNGQYYFGGAGAFRPFAGLGLGFYSLAAVNANIGSGGSSEQVAVAESKFGFYPRVGFDFHHFSMSADYNVISATNAVGGGGDFKNSYLGIRLGFFIGGGKK